MSGKLDLANMMQQAAERHGDKVFVHIEKPLQYRMIEGDAVTFPAAFGWWTPWPMPWPTSWG